MDTQALLDLCRANEEAPGFHLGGWTHSCGTYGCLVGNFCLSHPLDDLQLDYLGHPFLEGVSNSMRGAAARFGITDAEAMWLFAYCNFDRNKFGFIRQMGVGGFQLGDMRQQDDRASAINRVRKLIAYKVRKRLLWFDDRGCIKECARRAEGDHNVMAAVLEDVNARNQFSEVIHA